MAEPVAWMFKLCFHPTKMDVCLEKPSEELYPNPIPLYTAPRHLSDEEIDDFVGKICEEDICLPEKIPSDEFLNLFARAILKKASEK